MHLTLEPQNIHRAKLRTEGKNKFNNNSCRLPLSIMDRSSETGNQHRYSRPEQTNNHPVLTDIYRTRNQQLRNGHSERLPGPLPRSQDKSQ